MNRRQFITRTTGTLASTCLRASAADAKSKTVWGIAELWQWLYETQVTSGHDSADCLQAHLDHGIRHVLWALGRSTLDYQSALPTSTMYVGDTRPETQVIGESFRRECSLRAAVAFAGKHDMILYARLGMNRHYGDALGGLLRSKYIAEHPEWMERHRGGQVDGTKVSFAVPEYRAERIAVLMEAAQLGVHGLCLDFCRQPPVARYHPLIIEPWLKAGHDDPRDLKAGSPEFLAWARHRAEFVNLLLRDLRSQLRDLERQTKRRVSVMVRIPEATLEVNLMEGLDLRTWLKEGWVDEVTLDPLWIWGFDYPDTARAYRGLTQAHGLKLYGGANTTAGKGMKANARAFLERVSRSYDEGVDGIALFQTDAALLAPELKAMLGPLMLRLHDPLAVAEMRASARQKKPEMLESERWFGLDNHSLMPQLSGSPRLSLDTL